MKKVFFIGLLLLGFTSVAGYGDEVQLSTEQSTISSSSAGESSTTTETESNATSTESTSSSTSSGQEMAHSTDLDAEAEAQKVADKISEKANLGGDTSQDIPQWTTGKQIRSTLQEAIENDESYALTQTELDGLTDLQLEQALQLANRYSQDTMGLDISAYTKILKALFISHQMSWEVIEPQLAFDPSGFNSFSEMIPHVNELKAYLAALYPSNSVFLSMSTEVSDEWLISILNNLSTVEKEVVAQQGYLWPGRIAWILQAVEEGKYAVTETETSTTATSETENSLKESSSSSAEQSQTTTSDEAKKKSEGNFPKTGDTQRNIYMVLGFLVLFFVLFLFLKRNRKK